MRRSLAILALLPLLSAWLWGCGSDSSTDPGDPGDPGDPPPGVTEKTCLGCHSSESDLRAALEKEEGSKVEVTFKSDG